MKNMVTMKKLGLTILLAGLMLPGCGYKPARQGLYRSDVKTVAVPIFQSKEFRRDLEFRLTEALVKRIEMDTPWKVVDQSRADTLIEGEVIQEKQVSYSPDFITGNPREYILTLVISFKWKDLRTGRVLVEKKNWSQTGTWIPPVGENEYQGQNVVIEKLAESIVEQMQEPW